MSISSGGRVISRREPLITAQKQMGEMMDIFQASIGAVQMRLTDAGLGAGRKRCYWRVGEERHGMWIVK